MTTDETPTTEPAEPAPNDEKPKGMPWVDGSFWTNPDGEQSASRQPTGGSANNL